VRTPVISLCGCSRNGGNHRYFFFFGSFFRFVFAMSRNCFPDIDSTICSDAPLRLDFLRPPRLAASAAPATICCFFDSAGIFINRHALRRRTYALEQSDHSIVIGLVAQVSPIRMIAVLLTPADIAPRALELAIGIGTYPDTAILSTGGTLRQVPENERRKFSLASSRGIRFRRM